MSRIRRIIIGASLIGAGIAGSALAAGPAQSAPYYSNCSEARAAGAAPLYRGDPGYRSALDRDNDGIACETGSGSGSRPPATPPAPPAPSAPSAPSAPRQAPPQLPPQPAPRTSPFASVDWWPPFIPVPDVRFGDYCSSFKWQEGHTITNKRAFCVQVRGTGTYVWAPERRVTPQNPNVVLAASGQSCVNTDAMARDSRARTLFCNAARGGSRYSLQPY
ncbi:excalibur calcium-binding domain-containing protein [Gordonia sp. L191]|uniref:excalibur calcium-binding domain-containing protein n=1 Tax=Gordonia sp. L191 TaxID=2982699 RepID=UPI0024C00D0F|nr:excalibur calcium-binding domain-containing protein [Gordonia sp. L191]WHU45959.1 excalibur calcium-binding domain-containing protein [Gordonia sp. L191]